MYKPSPLLSEHSFRDRSATVYDRKRLFFNDSTVRNTVCGGRSVYGPVPFDLGKDVYDEEMQMKRMSRPDPSKRISFQQWSSLSGQGRGREELRLIPKKCLPVYISTNPDMYS